MSNKTFNAKINNKAKKGISPVIATVILVAVAVVIAAALAGFSGSLFGSYSQGPQVKIQSLTVHAGAPGSVEAVMSNSGSASDMVTSISINGVGKADAINVQLPANTNPIPVTGNNGAFALDAGTLTEGQQVSVIVTMQSGVSISQTVNVVA